MKQLIAGFALAMMLTGCAYKLSESKIDAIPEQYQAQVSPSLVKAYFDTARGPHNWKYKNSVIDGDVVRASLLGPLDLEVGSITAHITKSASGKTVLVSLRTAENVYWEEDVDFIRSELYRFLLGGRAASDKAAY